MGNNPDRQARSMSKERDIKDIAKPFAKEMDEFERYFREELKSPSGLLTIATNYVFRRKGKRMRPLLVLLSASAVGEITQKTYASATLIELLHNASIVHDDVVDETYERRGQLSLFGLWNSRVAVLVGDFFLSRGISLATKGKHYDVLDIISRTVGDLSEGELSQIEHARKLDITEGDYYDIIRRKTAALISACTEAGAVSAGADDTERAALAQYGENLGIAFQIRDDMFDYSPKLLVGKPSLNDICEQKLTLPLIYALGRADRGERSDLLAAVRRRPRDKKTGQMALDMVLKYCGLDYAEEKMREYSEKARQSIGILGASEAQASLLAIVDYNERRTV